MQEPSVHLHGIFIREAHLSAHVLPFELENQPAHYDFNLAHTWRKLDQKNLYAATVVLDLKGTLGKDRKLADGKFVAEVVAELTGFDAVATTNVLSSYLPTQALAYLREAASSASIRAGLPLALLPALPGIPAAQPAAAPAIPAANAPRLTQ